MYRCDQSKVKIIAGDLTDGYYDLQGSQLRLTPSGSVTVSESIELDGKLRSLELKDSLHKDNIEALMGAGVGALLGLRFGLVGAVVGGVGGHFLTKGFEQISVKGELSDGRKFIAVMHPDMYKRLRTYAANQEYAKT